MNNRIFPNFSDFNEPEEENTCPMCELVEAYSHEIAHVETREELEELIHFLAEDAFQNGYTLALQDDVEVKTDLLSGMYQGFQ